MKKTILFIAATFSFAGLAITGCDSSAQKVENAQDNVNEANKNLDKANQEYLADIESYRKATNAKIDANNKSLAEFKARVASDKADAKNDYKNKIAVLEKRDSDLKLKLDDYKSEGKENWEAFKKAFDSDMNDIGDAINKMVNKTTK